jgi:hypothetical protein
VATLAATPLPLALLLGALLLAAPLAARERLDKVQLRSGDRVTGEIITLHSATLTVRTLDFGTIEIDWPEVTSIVSPQLFEVELTDGRRIVGRLEASAEPAQLAMQTGISVVPVACRDVVAMVQLGRTLWQSRRGYLDVGLEYASAEKDAQFSLGAQIELRGRHVRSATTLEAVLSDLKTVEQRVRGDLRSVLEVPVSRRWVLVGAALAERNDDLDLDARLTASVTALWIAHRTRRGYVGLGGGIAQSEERYNGEGSGESVTAALIQAGGDYDRFGPFGTHANLFVHYLPMLSGPARHRIEMRANLRQKVTTNFTFNLTPYYSYDSRPPEGSFAKEDWGLVSSIGWIY